MTKKVLDVGNCAPDHAAVVRALTRRFDVDVRQAKRFDDAAEALRAGDFALVLVNRKLDVDYSDGIDVVRAIKADETLADVPVMLVTNYADHQQTAVAEGALRGFGKLELDALETIDRLAAVLGLPQGPQGVA